jgi:S-adenosylmethionine:tRNA ribosyltransferase-isomerase
MLLSDFDYNLPSELIAQEPAKPRDAARLLVVNKTKNSATLLII